MAVRFSSAFGNRTGLQGKTEANTRSFLFFVLFV